MNAYTAWITLLRDGIPRRHELHADSMEQARDRSGGKHGNKGSEAAVAALQMAACLYPRQSLAISVWGAA